LSYLADPSIAEDDHHWQRPVKRPPAPVDLYAAILTPSASKPAGTHQGDDEGPEGLLR